MNKEDSKDLNDAIRDVHGQMIARMKKMLSITGSEWDKIDHSMYHLATDLITHYTSLCTTLFELLGETDVEVPRRVQHDMLMMNIEAATAGSLLLAHFMVSESNGRTCNDAHLHLDRVLRAALAENAVAVREIRRDNNKEGDRSPY